MNSMNKYSGLETEYVSIDGTYYRDIDSAPWQVRGSLIEVPCDRRRGGSMKTYLGFNVDGDGRLRGAPCGCSACDEQVQPGHSLCDVPDDDLLLAEENRSIYRSLSSAGWQWFLRETT
jgi:hypothetical protein